MLEVFQTEYGILVRIQLDAGEWLDQMFWFSELGRTGAEMAAARWGGPVSVRV